MLATLRGWGSFCVGTEQWLPGEAMVCYSIGGSSPYQAIDAGDAACFFLDNWQFVFMVLGRWRANLNVFASVPSWGCTELWLLATLYILILDNLWQFCVGTEQWLLATRIYGNIDILVSAPSCGCWRRSLIGVINLCCVGTEQWLLATHGAQHGWFCVGTKL